MIKIDIPGKGTLGLKNCLFDVNGTLAVDGHISDEVKAKLRRLSNSLKLYIATADTFGTVENEVKDIDVEIEKVPHQGYIAKAKLVNKLRASETVAIGNGFNDHLMLRDAALSIVVIGQEGAAKEAIFNSDIVVTCPNDALDLLLNPKRIIATLRS